MTGSDPGRLANVLGGQPGVAFMKRWDVVLLLATMTLAGCTLGLFLR